MQRKMKREIQLQYNIESLLDELYNDICDGHSDPMTKYNVLDYVKSQVYDMESNGDGHIKYAKGICDELKFLGNNYIDNIILEYAYELGITL